MKAGKRARAGIIGRSRSEHQTSALPRVKVKQCAAATAGARLEASSPGAPCSAPCDGGPILVS
eukprot:scaffold1130_cov127-Isochrysis_galbana.AAC.13